MEQFKDQNKELDRNKYERDLVEDLVEQFLEDPTIAEYVKYTLDQYQLDFDHRGAMTGDQLELVCQYQNLIYMQLLSGMMRNLSGRQLR